MDEPRLTISNVGARFDVIGAEVRRISRFALRWFRQPVVVENKRATDSTASIDPVTEADRHVEIELRTYLQQEFPRVPIIGEEFDDYIPADPISELRWIIDPIDGTRAFVCGRPMWGTLLGLECNGEPVAGFMHVPSLDETWLAVQIIEVGDGSLTPSWIQKTLIQGEHVAVGVSSTVTLAESRLAATSPSMFVTGDEQQAFDRLSRQCGLVRFDGDCYNYALLAAGHLDLVVENKLAAYDVSALVPIVRASGGIITDRRGESAANGGFIVAAANAELHALALQALA